MRAWYLGYSEDALGIDEREPSMPLYDWEDVILDSVYTSESH